MLRIQILLTAFHTFSTIQFFFCDLQSAFLKNDRCKQCHQLQFVRYVERACLVHMLVKEDKIETTCNKQSHILLLTTKITCILKACDHNVSTLEINPPLTDY